MHGAQAKGAASRASAAATDNPAKEFANRGKAAVQENLPVDGPAEWDLSSLQVNVSQKLEAQASSTAKQASNKVDLTTWVRHYLLPDASIAVMRPA